MTYMHRPGSYIGSFGDVFYQDTKNSVNFNFQGIDWVKQDIEISLEVEVTVNMFSEVESIEAFGTVSFTNSDGTLAATCFIGSFNFKKLCDLITKVFKRDLQEELIESLDIPLIPEYQECVEI